MTSCPEPPAVVIGHPRPERRSLRAVLVVLGLLALFAVRVAVASATAPAPRWTIDSFATPTNFSAADSVRCNSTEEDRCDSYEVTVRNAGSRPTDGSAVTISDTLAPGLTLQGIQFEWVGPGAERAGVKEVNLAEGLCSSSPLRCSLPAEMGPDETLIMYTRVKVEPGAPTPLINAATVSGGGAAEASTSRENPISSALPAFGMRSFGALIAGFDGAEDTQAADHPYELTVRMDLANSLRITPQGNFGATSVQDPKDFVIDLPLGFLGSTRSTPRCTLAQLAGGCPPATQVGFIRSEPAGASSVAGPIYNLAPERGVAAEFGYLDALKGTHVLTAGVVATSVGYKLRVTARDIPQIQLTDILTTFFGTPAEKNGGGAPSSAMLTNPASCTGEPLLITVHTDSWQHPGAYNADGTPNLGDPRWVSTSSGSPPVTGCDRLQISPTLRAQPETDVADSPTGLSFDLTVSDTESPGVLAAPPLKSATVRLPPGLALDPSAAAGLAACSPSQIGWRGGSLLDFTPDPPTCPEPSKIGTVEVTTPLLPELLGGSFYLATQTENPFHTLVAGYLVIDDPRTGVIIKVPGSFALDASTGQVTASFPETPQLPFSTLHLRLKGGVTGALATPERCGTYTTTATLTPWSAPDSGPPATPSDSFAITSGCVSRFAPSFTALTTNPVAGAYSPFVLSFSRLDTDQELSGLAVSLPPGLLAAIANVPLCPESSLAQAARRSAAEETKDPSCPAASQVGTVHAGAGAGPDPFFVTGKVYLTGAYKGGPYALAVVVPVLAGPFDLGTVVVRQTIEIDPHDAHVTVTSDPFPTIIDGIPLRLRRVGATIDRPNFTFNPTNCTPMAIAGTLRSVAGTAARVSSHFQVGECARLRFKPKFTVLTNAKTSKANGASLHVKVTSSTGQANIAKVKVDLPKQLPSRLTTLQKACPDATFNANPASCPAASVVGSATAVTPILKNPLTGPAYLVSHAARAFPDLVIVLQGEGIVLDLVGNTDIKNGVTISSFNSVPDAPVTSFDLVLPQGPHSALAAHGNLCTTTKTVTKPVSRRVHGRLVRSVKTVKQSVPATLAMPTMLTGQNGAVIRQTTRVAVSGCPKHKKPRKHHRHGKGNSKNRKR
jgi:hypothetical protein